MQVIFTQSFFCDVTNKSFEEPLDDFDFGDSKKMAIEVGRAKYQCKFCDARHKLTRTVFREFVVATDIIVKHDPKTVGHLADRNADTISRAKKEDKEFAYKASRREAAKKSAEATGGKLVERDKTAKQWWRDGTVPGVKKYNKATDIPVIKNVEKFVKTGNDD